MKTVKSKVEKEMNRILKRSLKVILKAARSSKVIKRNKLKEVILSLAQSKILKTKIRNQNPLSTLGCQR